jgi:hypothetical protein
VLALSRRPHRTRTERADLPTVPDAASPRQVTEPHANRRPGHDARLGSAAMSDATLTGAKLSGAKLSGADLTGADLTGAGFAGAALTGAIWPANAAVPKGWLRDAHSGRLTRAP